MIDNSRNSTYYRLLIFFTGAITLSLEVIASRIMTPYFGVSLYIWTGILSITLVSLALGYYAGGWLSKRINAARQQYYFVTLPSFASLFLFAGLLVYPGLFHTLASFSLVGGSFIACLILLFVPLILLSAMNPLLVAILSIESSYGNGAGDSGAGLVFFISTVGSVIGVLLTAFIFIPNITNYYSVLFLGMALPVLALVSIWRSSLEPGIKKGAALVSCIALSCSTGLLIAAPSYLNKNEAITFNDVQWNIEKEYTSLFGNTKVIRLDKEITGKNGKTQQHRRWVYFQDGIAQNVMEHNGLSGVPFTYALEYMATAFRPNAESALVLGLGAGFVPERLRDRGIAVDVVEINPNSIEAARDYFHFTGDNIRVFEEDARTYVRHCENRYDILVVDLFHGDGIPDYLLTREFMHDLKQCMHPGSVAVFNSFGRLVWFDPSYYHILKTVKTEFSTVKIFHDDEPDESKLRNIFLVASQQSSLSRSDTKIHKVPPKILSKLGRIFSKEREIDDDLLGRAKVLFDENNIYSYGNAKNYLRYRKDLLKLVPPEILVN